MSERGETPYLSVIIPTKDRADTLETTLSELFRQRARSPFEIVVADNGSSDGTRERLEAAQQSSPVPMVVVSEPRPGPAAARNAAVEASSGEILLLLGDDTAPADPNLIDRHIGLHQEASDETFGVLGRIEWTPRAPVTEFMQWLDSGGPQFHYFELEAGPVDPTMYFYSSHLSLTRAIFDRAGGFDRRFKLAAFEDTDLGIRLEEVGFRLMYEPDLKVWHDHPTTLEDSLSRAIRVGRSAAVFHRIRDNAQFERLKTPSPLKLSISGLGAGPLAAASRLPWPTQSVKHRVWSLAHRFRFAQGYKMGLREPL